MRNYVACVWGRVQDQEGVVLRMAAPAPLDLRHVL